MNTQPRPPLPTVAVLATCCIAIASGCTTRAQREVYTQKMVGEMRVLEDQLYEADYVNRVLQDELEQCRNSKGCQPSSVDLGLAKPPPTYHSNIGPGVDSGRIPLPSVIIPEQGSGTNFGGPNSIDTLNDGFEEWDSSQIEEGTITEMGEPFSPNETEPRGETVPTPVPDFRDQNSGSGLPASPGVPDAANSADQPLMTPQTDRSPLPTPDPTPQQIPKPAVPTRPQIPERSIPTPDPSDPEFSDNLVPEGFPLPDRPMLPPAPTLPQPPGADDLRPDPIIEGEILPPPADPEQVEPPAGQIPLPDFLNLKQPTAPGLSNAPFGVSVPTAMKIHPSSGGQRSDSGLVEEMTVHLHAVDSVGRTVDLDQFDIDADLTLIISDPDAATDSRPLGRWEFNAVQTASMVGNDPLSGLHIPIRWDDRLPSGKTVRVVARLRRGDDEMTCEETIPVEIEGRMASQWMPRGVH